MHRRPSGASRRVKAVATRSDLLAADSLARRSRSIAVDCGSRGITAVTASCAQHATDPMHLARTLVAAPGMVSRRQGVGPGLHCPAECHARRCVVRHMQCGWAVARFSYLRPARARGTDPYRLFGPRTWRWSSAQGTEARSIERERVSAAWPSRNGLVAQMRATSQPAFAPRMGPAPPTPAVLPRGRS